MKLFQSIIRVADGTVQVIMTWNAKWYLPQGNFILPDSFQQPSCGVFGPTFEVTPGNSTDEVLRIIIRYSCQSESN